VSKRSTVARTAPSCTHRHHESVPSHLTPSLSSPSFVSGQFAFCNLPSPCASLTRLPMHSPCQIEDPHRPSRRKHPTVPRQTPACGLCLSARKDYTQERRKQHADVVVTRNVFLTICTHDQGRAFIRSLVRSLSSVSFFRCRHRLVVLCGLGTYVSTSSALPVASLPHSRAWPSMCSTLFGHPSPFVEAWFTSLALNRKPGKFAADSFSPSHQLMTSTHPHTAHTQEKIKKYKEMERWSHDLSVCEHVVEGGRKRDKRR
jgi:hypothetical protein